MQEGDRTQQQTEVSLGRYRLLRRIGRGGMGEVWLAEDPLLNRQVAIKTLPRRSQSDNEYVERFEREARVAASLSHPHILPIHDYGKQPLPNGQVITYIVMPHITGGTLADRLEQLVEQQTIMPSDEAVSYLSQAAEAIDFAHSKGVLHRDIKPSNMLLRDVNWLLLADFGIARILSDTTQSLTGAHSIGTPEYMAPEQAQGQTSPASDIYSLAIIAYLIFTGTLPFSADTGYAVMVQQMMTPPRPPKELNPTMPLALEQALIHGLAKDPVYRPPSARAFVDEIRRAISDPSTTLINRAPRPFPADGSYTTLNPVTPIMPAPFTPPAQVKRDEKRGVTRRQMLIGGGVTAAVLALGGAGAWGISRALHSTQEPILTPTPRPTPTPNPNAPTALLGHNQAASSLAWSPKANTLISAGADKQLMIWDVQAGAPKQPFQRLTLDNAGDNMQLAWSPDGKMIAISDALEPESGPSDIFVYKSDLSGFAPGYKEQTIVSPQGTTYTNAIAWAPGKYLITLGYVDSGSHYGDIALEAWDPAHPGKRFKLLQRDDLSEFLWPSPSGTKLALGTSNGALVGEVSLQGNSAHWRQLTPKILTNNGLGETTDTLAWSPDERYIAAVNNSAQILSIWDWQHNPEKPYQIAMLPGAQIVSLAWSPLRNNPLLATRCNNGTVYLWQINPKPEQFGAQQPDTPDPVRTLPGVKGTATPPINWSYPLVWSPDGQWLAGGYNDVNASILLWKL